MRSVVFFILLSFTTGCAHTAVVECWEPAEIDAQGINRISVIEFTGDQGTEMASALSTRLWENDFYTVIDPAEISTEIQPASYSEQKPLQSLLGSAKNAGVDAVIVGSVLQFHCDDQVLGSTEIDINSYANSIDSEGLVENSLQIEAEDVLYREATVTIAFRLVDVDTGEVRASKQISKHFRGEMKQGEQSLPEKGRILENLMAECLDEIVHMLAPHEMKCEMKLASCDFWTKGSGQVKRGLKLASRGDWEGAEAAWKDAISENPENHAAMYNLSIASARHQKYDIAEKYILDALKCEHKCTYTAGLEKIRDRRTALSRANDQREARVVSTDNSMWQ